MADDRQEVTVKKTVKVKWGELEKIPIYFSNQALIQNIQNEFILTFGQMTAPLFLTPPTKEELDAFDSVTITPIFRIAMTPDRLIELIGMLELNLRKFQNKDLES